MDQSTVLFVDDETDLREALAQGLELAGHRVEAYPNAEGVLDRVSRDFYGVLVTDIRMPKMDGLALMKAAFDIDTAFSVILITGHGDVPLAVEAMRAGAYDFIEKPFPVARLANVVERALEKRRLVLENRVLREQLGDTAGLAARLVGRSPAIERLRTAVQALAATDADVLILGETGAGKEVVARALHEEGVRKDGPFVALNCGALPADIIESELFGHEQGAFTGASRQRIGKLEHADGGTVFLDEIESMPLELQVKLLRVIENRTIERLGSNKTIALDVRFVAATKVDLEKESTAGRFRRDLYYRLNVVSLDIPPLRDRREDIPVLFHHLAREARARYRREIPDLTPEVMAELMAREWPGNVRELRNVADRFVLGVDKITGTGTGADASEESAGTPLSVRVGKYEKALIAAELRRQGGSIKATYEALGLSRKALYEKMKKFGLEKEEALEM
ncbi:two-component system C4-dicarboxylate transport response regulator DctD [Breoghania corrubedonensis]|uniref:Two-component system C4-dicarboxylate transport response regulator DctD n=1 Tax=Breoghania corrubedonensis TaxID=665038 RepID=A0A2T5V6N8_9HYPH|nr:sigma-54 dependent transcriptional regulator [Breoghania corrubedonensis]PTW59423.1 two-component system C4-dicarboxylate transport response regulator DctD [Breoghania corrubedonensis]